MAFDIWYFVHFVILDIVQLLGEYAYNLFEVLIDKTQRAYLIGTTE